MTTQPTRYIPPGQEKYSFGMGRRTDAVEASLAGHTDSHGRHVLTVDCDSSRHEPVSVEAEATVIDVNRQTWSASSALLVHPAQVYVGLRRPGGFLATGEDICADAIVCDVEGRLIAGHPVRVRLCRVDWRDGAEEDLVVQEATVTSTSGPVPIRLRAARSGIYRLSAVVTDATGRSNQTDIDLWTWGGPFRPDYGSQAAELSLMPDKQSYRPGDTAHILMHSRQVPAEALVTVRRDGLAGFQQLHLSGPEAVLDVPIEGTSVPQVEVNVRLLAGNGDQASARLTLSVPPWDRTLSVVVSPGQSEVAPGTETSVNVQVRDANGRPVPEAEMALVAVDEAVLALAGSSIRDPMEAFYPARGGNTEDLSCRDDLLTTPWDALQGDVVDEDILTVLKRLTRRMGRNLVTDGTVRGRISVSLKGLGPEAALKRVLRNARFEYKFIDDTILVGSSETMSKIPNDIFIPASIRKKLMNPVMAGTEAPLALRQDFGPLALFVPSVRTDATGRARVSMKIPDSLTRYRITAVAAAGPRQFGRGDASVTARLPLMVRPSPPRFLTFGDRCDLPVVVQNNTDAPLHVDVLLRAVNALLPEGDGHGLEVPAHNRVEVRFPIATVDAGMASFQIAAVAGQMSDAASIEIPVYTPAAMEAFATYGAIDSGAVSQPVHAPPDAYAQFGGLEVSTSATQLGELTDALLYLQAYPYECTEQISSRIISVAVLGDVLAAFHARGLPDADAMRSAMVRDVARLCALQHVDGGFSFWKQDDETWPYVSVFVAHALMLASQKGCAVPQAAMDACRRYLRHIAFPAWYGNDERRAIAAYALYVRALMGDLDRRAARAIAADGGLERLPLEAAGWLLPVADVEERDALRRLLDHRVDETAGDAHFATSYLDGEHLLLSSERRVDAVVLDATIADRPKCDLTPKLVRGLLDHRRRGRWETTQENAFVLIALSRYFHTYERVTPDFVARAWLGDQYAGEHRYQGYSADRFEVDVPMSMLTRDSTLTLSKSGPGRLYYRVGMRYAPRDLKVPAASHGFDVRRTYEPVDDGHDVARDPDGTWHVKAGARVRVRVELIVPARRYHVALVDPLPGGFEAQNPELLGTQSVATDDRSFWVWYEHDNLRDDRAEAFNSLLRAGSYTYTYVCRATTPGTFVASGPHAEEMYHPETFGRGTAERVVVEAAPQPWVALAIEEEPSLPVGPVPAPAVQRTRRVFVGGSLVIPLEFVSVEDAMSAVTNCFPDLEVQEVPGQNMILIRGSREDVLGARSLCSSLDRFAPSDR